MIVRMLMLVVLIAQTRLNSIDATENDEERESMGGEGFANVINLVVLLGVLILAILIVVGILAVAGQFQNELIDPVV
jgi:preprotein translocase subunit SecG